MDYRDDTTNIAIFTILLYIIKVILTEIHIEIAWLYHLTTIQI